MKYLILALGVIVSFANTAMAADATDGKSSAIAVERIMCERTMIHTPSADTNYKPGVDVNGDPVAPADLNATPIASVDTTYTEVPLTVDLANKLNLSRPAEMNALVGRLKLYKDGRVFFNGQDITNQANVVCGRELSSGQTVQPAPPVISPPALQPDIPMPGSAAPSATTTQ